MGDTGKREKSRTKDHPGDNEYEGHISPWCRFGPAAYVMISPAPRGVSRVIRMWDFRGPSYLINEEGPQPITGQHDHIV